MIKKMMMAVPELARSIPKWRLLDERPRNAERPNTNAWRRKEK